MTNAKEKKLDCYIAQGSSDKESVEARQTRKKRKDW